MGDIKNFIAARVAKELRGLYENHWIPHQAMQAQASFHQRQGGASGSFRKGKLPGWPDILECD